MARKKPGAYAPLSAHYADDERIMAAGEEAELLYLRALAYCARTPKTEGHLTHAQIQFRLGLDGAENRAEKCAEVGLLVRTDSGYRIASWLKWNLSAEEVERVRSQDRHRKAPAPTSGKSGTGSGKRSGNEGDTDNGIRVPYTETDTDTKQVTTLAPLSDEPPYSMPRAKRACRLPEPFIVDEAMNDWAMERNMSQDFINKQTERFINYWRGVPGQKGTKLDWRSTWKNWLLKDADKAPTRVEPVGRLERSLQRVTERGQTA